MKRKKSSSLNIAIILPVIAVIVAIIVFTTVYIRLKPQKKVVDALGTTQVAPIANGNTEKPAKETESYIEETNYKGELSQFPELYQIPFKKTVSYISNKEFSAKHSDTFEECETKATQFMEDLFSVDYREIVKDKYGYAATVAVNCDYAAPITLNFGKEDENTTDFFTYILQINDYFATNMVEMNAKFFTDDSLIYSDYYTFVRGELVFTIYSSEDATSEFEIGKEYKIPMEVALQRAANNPNIRNVVSFGRATDTTFFLNP